MKGSPQDAIASWNGEEEIESHVDIDKDCMSQLPQRISRQVHTEKKDKGGFQKGEIFFQALTNQLKFRV